MAKTLAKALAMVNTSSSHRGPWGHGKDHAKCFNTMVKALAMVKTSSS